MAKDRKKLQHIHSSVPDKQPTPATLEVAEIAVNNAAEQEFLSIKNTDNKVVRFSSDGQIIEWIERKEVMPYVGYVRGDGGPEATSGDTPASDEKGSYGISNDDLLNNKSELVFKLNQVAADKTTKHDKVNGAKDMYNEEINPTDDFGVNDGAGFFIDMSRYAMRDGNPSFSSLTATCQTTFSGNTFIRDGASGNTYGTDTGHTLDIKITDTVVSGVTWNETLSAKTEDISGRTTTIGNDGENLHVIGTTTEVHDDNVTITNKSNVAENTSGTTTIDREGDVSENNQSNVTVVTSGNSTTTISGNTIVNHSGTTTENKLGNVTENTTGTTTINNTGKTTINVVHGTEINSCEGISANTNTFIVKQCAGETGEAQFDFCDGFTVNSDDVKITECTANGSIVITEKDAIVNAENTTINDSGNTVINTTGNVVTNTTGTTTIDRNGNVSENNQHDVTVVTSGNNTTTISGNSITNVSGSTTADTGGNVVVTTSGTTTIDREGNVSENNQSNVTVVTSGNSTTTISGNSITNVSGNTTADTGGDVTVTTSGDTTIDREGNVSENNQANVTLVTSGTTTETKIGNVVENHSGTTTENFNGNFSGNTTGTTTEIKIGNVEEYHSGTTTETKKEDVTENNLANKTENTTGNIVNNTTGTTTENLTGKWTVNVTGGTEITSCSDVTINTNDFKVKQCAGTSGTAEFNYCGGFAVNSDVVTITECNEDGSIVITEKEVEINAENTTINDSGNTEINTTVDFSANTGGDVFVNTTGETTIDRIGDVSENNQSDVTVVTSGNNTTTISGNNATSVSGSTTADTGGNVVVTTSGTTTETKGGNVTENNQSNKVENTIGYHKLYVTGDTCINSQANADLYGKVSTNIGVACDGTPGSATTVIGTSTLDMSGTTTTLSANTTTINSCGGFAVSSDDVDITQCDSNGSITITEKTVEVDAGNATINDSGNTVINTTGNTNITTSGSTTISTEDGTTINTTAGSTNINTTGDTNISTNGTTNVASTNGTNITTTGNTCIQSTADMNIGGDANTRIGYNCAGNGISDNVYIYASNSLEINSPTTTISGNSACIVATGDTTIGGDSSTHVGYNCAAGGISNNSYIFGSESVRIETPETYITGNTNVSGNTTIGGGLNVSGNTVIGGTTNISGKTTIDDDLDVTGAATITGTVYPLNGLSQTLSWSYGNVQSAGAGSTNFKDSKSFVIPQSVSNINRGTLSFSHNGFSGSFDPASNATFSSPHSALTIEYGVNVTGKSNDSYNTSANKTVSIPTSVEHMNRAKLDYKYGVDVTGESDGNYDPGEGTGVTDTIKIPTCVSHINRAKLDWAYVTDKGSMVADTYDPGANCNNEPIANKVNIPKSIKCMDEYGSCFTIDIPLCVNGTITASGAIYSSDRNLKENINTIERSDFKKVKTVPLRSFNLKSDRSKRKTYGVIAQEVQEAGLNELVHVREDGTLGVDYTSLLILRAAYLEDYCGYLNGKIAELENKIDEMQKKD